MAEYDERMARYAAPGAPKRYRQKFRGGPLRRLSAWREHRILRLMLERFGPFSTVLDCACGPGRILPDLSRANPGDGAPTLLAMDLSAPMVHEAASAAEQTGVRCFVGDACHIPLPDKSVDLVVCMRLIQHFDAAGVAAILQEAGRVARHGVLTSFSDTETWKYRRSGSRRRGLTREELGAIANGAGLTIEAPVLRVGGAFSFLAMAYLRA